MDVLLHYKGNTVDVTALLNRTQRALEDFPCRVLPIFTPWFPAGRDASLPIRAAKAPPTISPGDLEKIQTHQLTVSSDPNPNCDEGGLQSNSAQTSLARPPTGRVQACCGLRTAPSAHCKDTLPTEKEVRRSWSVFSQRGLLIQNRNTQAFSKQFHKLVWKHRLHMRQRAKWVVGETNCVTAGDVELVWRGLNHAIRDSKLPTCNANIQRDLTQIWVFCDVLYCEYVGKFLKEELQLTGKITLCVHKLGNIFSF